MCVIAFAEDTRPSPEMVAKMFTRNSDGAGIAWREPEESGKLDSDGQPVLEVVWKKGLTLPEVQKLVVTVPLPFVVHFRVSSCEKPARKSLTHPFPIEEDAPVWLNGRTEGYVLFHNGHHGEWKKDLKDTLKSFGKKLPDGKFSDTRAMALMCSLYGKGYMDLIEEKGIAFGPDDIEMFWGAGWDKVDGVWCSNKYFTSATVNQNDLTGAYAYAPTPTVRPTVISNPYTPAPPATIVHRRNVMCRAASCIEQEALNAEGYCPQHAGFTVGVTKQPANTTPLPNDEPGGARRENPFAWLKLMEERHKAGEVGKRQVKRAQKAYDKWLLLQARTPKVKMQQQQLVQRSVH